MQVVSFNHIKVKTRFVSLNVRLRNISIGTLMQQMPNNHIEFISITIANIDVLLVSKVLSKLPILHICSVFKFFSLIPWA